MKYSFQPKIQIISALIAAIVVAVMSLLMEGDVDWLTLGSVAVGVAIGMGFQQKIKKSSVSNKTKED